MLDRLSVQEVRCLQALVEGLRNKQIAERLGVAEKTVANTLNTAYRKLGVARRQDAVEEFRKNWAETGKKTGVADQPPPRSHVAVVVDRWSGRGTDLNFLSEWLYAAYLDLGKLRTPPRWGGSRIGPIVLWALFWLVLFSTALTLFQVGASTVSILYGETLNSP